MPDRLSASQASKHMACSASANLELAIPGWTPPVEDPNADNAANRGTALHEVFAKVMALNVKDAEKFSAAVSYAATLRKTRRFKVLIEQPARATWLMTQPWTTADLVLYTQDELHIIDWKTGQIPVSPVDNKQMLYYAATYGHLAPKAKGATLHIVQPWADIMEGWFASSQVIAQFMADALMAEAGIQAGNVTFMPGDHCTFCAANPISRAAKGHPSCPAMTKLYFPRHLDEDAVLGLED